MSNADRVGQDSSMSSPAPRRRPGAAQLESLRKQNLGTVLRDLHFRGPGSRTALTKRTSLERSTLGILVRELGHLGLVVEVPGEASGSRGRPSPVVHPSPNAVALGIQIFETALRVAAIGIGGRSVQSLVVPCDVVGVPAETTVREIAGAASALRRRLGPDVRIVGTGVAVPGLVRMPDGLVQLAPNLTWNEVPIGSLLEGWTDVLGPVHVAHTGNLGALAEQLRGAAVGIDDLIYISGGFGIGGGVISNGRQLDGARGFGAEFGHMIVRRNGDQCACGAKGCFEAEAGGRALLRNGDLPLASGINGVNQLLDAAASGDSPALGAAEQTAGWLGVGISNLINIFNPDLVVLGGIYGRMYRLASSIIDDGIEQQALQPSRTGVRVVVSDLGEDAPLLGAAELAWSRVLDDPQLVGRHSTGAEQGRRSHAVTP